MSAKKTRSSSLPLFEEDYLIRDIGRLAQDASAALTELVANAFDAGASYVNIIIPSTKLEKLVVADDGHGMTSRQFHERWMKMGYNRLRHQGVYAEFPPARAHSRKRLAYGRNGIGRHSLLCFADSYTVETWRDGGGARFVISTSSENVPFKIESEEKVNESGVGTRLSVIVDRHLPDPDNVRQILSARFLHDPEFTVRVNGESIELAELSGLIERQEIPINEDEIIEAFVVDTTKSAISTKYQGIAFWISGRLVGTPSWDVGGNVLLDGRSRFAKRYSIVVRSNSFSHENIEQDWSRFKDTESVAKLFASVTIYVRSVIDRLSSNFVRETSEDAIIKNKNEFEVLPKLARIEVAQFTEELVKTSPTIHPDTLSLAVKAVINLEKSRSGASLLEKLTKIDDADVESLDRLLSEWSVRDALSVLDEIDRRLEVIVAIEKLSNDPEIDEVHTLHPLVTQARWVFGPEFDSPEYSSNLSLKNAIHKVLGKEAQSEDFINHLRRPDLLIRSDATFSVVGVDGFEADDASISKLRDILIIELKRGGFTLARNEMDQAGGYVEDLLHCGLLDGAPQIRAFVVGHKISDKLERKRTIGDKKGIIEAVTYGQLVRTANKRLFKLKEAIPAKYEQLTGNELAAKIMGLPNQSSLTLQ